jgi:DNA adenine methylase
MDSVLKWPGGKNYLAEKIIALFPRHIHYVEGFFGSGAVLFKKSPFNCSEVVNDLNEELINFWQVLRDPLRFQTFLRVVQATPFSEKFWIETISNQRNTDETTKAIAFFIRCRQSMMGGMKSFAPISKSRTRQGMNEQVAAWLTAVEGLPEAHARLKRVLILNRHIIELLRTQDSPDTFFYLDPPYVPDSRVANGMYKHEMTEQDHKNFLNQLTPLRGKWILSGYSTPLYESMLKGYRRVEVKIANNMSTEDVKEIKTEVLWMNFNPPINNLLGV